MNPEIAHPEEHVSRAWQYQPTEGFYDEMVAHLAQTERQRSGRWEAVIRQRSPLGNAHQPRGTQKGNRTA